MKVIELISQLLQEDMNAQVTIQVANESNAIDADSVIVDGLVILQDRHGAFEVPLVPDTDLFRRP